MKEDSSLFGSRSSADTLRSASATRGDAAVLQLAANSRNLSLTEAAIWRISVKRFQCQRETERKPRSSARLGCFFGRRAPHIRPAA